MAIVVSRACTVAGCEDVTIARGLCRRHYNTYLRNLEVADPSERCAVAGCTRRRYARGWCQRHYYRAQRNGGDPTAFRQCPTDESVLSDGSVWCSGHRSHLPPENFGASRSKYRCRACARGAKYGLTGPQVDALELGGLCPLCEKRPSEVIDHDHETGQLRGLLCRRCNGALGTLTENGVRRAVAYLDVNRHGGKRL